MKIKDKRRSSHVKRIKLFSLNKSYQSVKEDDESCGNDEGLLQESSPQPLVIPPIYSTRPSNSENAELMEKEGNESPSTPDGFFELIDGRNFDFASVAIQENEHFQVETAPTVAGGSNTTSDGLTREAQVPINKKKHSLCDWPEDKTNDVLVEEAWQESADAQPTGEGNSPVKAPNPEYVVSGTIELKTVDQPSGITFQKRDHICPLKIQGFSPFSQFKMKTDLKPGMVVLQINGRDMTWESAREAVIEIKKAKPGKVTITAIAPSKVMSAPKALVDKLSTPPPTPVNQEQKESLAKTKEIELDTGPEWPNYIQKDTGTTAMQDETKEIAKPSVPTHYRDPSLTIIDSTISDASEDITLDAGTSGGPSFKELNPSFTRVDSSVTTDSNGVSPKQEPGKPASHPLDSKLRLSSPKRTPVPLLGRMDDEVEMHVVYVGSDSSDEKEVKTNSKHTMTKLGMDVVYVGADSSDEEEDEEEKVKTTKLYTPKQSYKVNVVNPWEPHTKPPLPPKRVSSAEMSPPDPPVERESVVAEASSSVQEKVETQKPSVAEAASSVEEKVETQTDKEGGSESMESEKEESQDGSFFLCDAFDVHITPMLATMKDFSDFANRITERMPSWMRVLCDE